MQAHPLDCCNMVRRASREALSLLGALRLVELIVIAARWQNRVSGKEGQDRRSW
jgi:hypothetical protein